MRIPCTLDGRPYVVEWRGARIQTLDSSRETVDQGVEPGEQTLRPNAAWRRTGEDFILGAGQTWFDLNEESVRRRFRHSQGIDPWDRREIKLHKSALGSSTTNSRLANTSWGQAAASVVANSKLFISIGPIIDEVTDPTAATWSSTTRIDFGLDPVTSIASDGTRVWGCSGADTIQMWDAVANTVDLTFSSSDNRAYLLLYANGRLIAAGDVNYDNVLYELSATGKRTDIWTHPSSNWTWDAATSAPNGIYVAGHQGDKAEIYLITNVDATGALNAPYHVMALPDGETITAMCHYGGVMVLGTSRGIRLATIGGSGFLSHGPLLEMPDPVVALEPQGEFVWFNYTDPDNAANQGLARLSLARFVEPLVPAWAPDLAGASVAGWKTTSITTYDGRRYFSMTKSGLGNGLRWYGEDDADYIASGEFSTGRVTFGIPDPKVFTGLSIGMEPIPTGASIGAEFNTEDGDTLPLPAVTGAGEKHHRWTESVTDEWVEVTITLDRGSTVTETPVLHRWTLEGLPVPTRTQEIYLPVILHGKVQHEQVPRAMNTYSEFETLMRLIATRKPVTLNLGNWTQRVYVDGLFVGEGDGFVGVKDWNDDQSWIDATWMLKLVTLDP